MNVLSTDGAATGDGAVLVPTGVTMQSHACMRSLNRRGIHTVVASEREEIPQFASRYCSEQVHLSSPPQDIVNYKNELVELASRSDIEAIVPVREYDAYILSKYADEFESVVSFVAPDMATLEKAHDRVQLAREAEQAGVPRIRTRRLSAVEDWDSDQIVKSRYNLLTDEYTDAIPADSAREARSVRFLPAGVNPDSDAIRDEMHHDPIVQSFVPISDRICYSGLWDSGEPVSTYQHRQIRSNSWVGGGGVYRKSVHAPEVEAVAHDLLSHLDWHGLACIEYLQDATTGEWKFIEINPRIWQSLPEAIRAGVDFPYHYWQVARGAPTPDDDDYEAGNGCHMAYGELSHLLSIRRDESPFADPPSLARTTWAVAKSCVTNPRFDYLHLDDPYLALGAIRAGLSADSSEGERYGTLESPSDAERRDATTSDDGARAKPQEPQ